MASKRKGISRRTASLLWMALIVVVIGVLIYLEQISVLYVLATFSLVVLLLIVGFADLEGVKRSDIEAKDS
ncbi:MAG: hypothetical protein JO053_10510 [Acidobacteria bacterium]|nr:hypothetical protein [Acidobacteriota bacterium]